MYGYFKRSSLYIKLYFIFILGPKPRPDPGCPEFFNPVCGKIKDKKSNTLEFKTFE